VAICLIHQANYLLDQQIRRMEKDFVEKGGLRENMTRARLRHRGGNKKKSYRTYMGYISPANVMKTLQLIVFTFLATNLHAVEECYPEASRESRVAAAKAILAKDPDVVTVYAKGLCCPSCAIGIRKKVGKLDFVDTKRLKKGVDLDAKMQLATIALKKGATPKVDALAKAIDDAGYDGIHLYRMEGGELKEVPLPRFIQRK
jgi:four helix bundle suffix protein